MAAIRHELDRDLFKPNDEHLLAVVLVSKLLKKKKTSFLCIVEKTEKPFFITIYQVKKNDKNQFKKKNSWHLNDLKSVNGRVANGDSHEFDLQFDKIYKWFSINVQERRNFLIVLWKQCLKYLPKQKPIFTNVPQEWFGDTNLLFENEVTVSPGNIELLETEDFLALSEREEQDLNRLLDQCDFGISNAEAFIEMLAKDLSILDGENVHTVLASEQQVAQLMSRIEKAVAEVERLETRVDAYDEVLCHIRDTMGKMEEKNLLIEVANRNNGKLRNCLEHVISQLDLPARHQAALNEADLATTNGLQEAIAAGKALVAAMNAEIEPALVQLAAVQEQRKRFDKWKTKFSHAITRHLNNLFIHLGNEPIGTTLNDNGTAGGELGLTLPSRANVHKELTAYAELMHWAKTMDRKSYVSLTKVYTSSLSKLYERDIRQFFEEARQLVGGRNAGVPGGQDIVSGSNVAGGSASGGRGSLSGTSGGGTGGTSGTNSAGAPLLGLERELWTTELVDPAQRRRFDQVLETALAQLEPVCLAEQNFCVHFFQLDVLSPSTKNTQTTLDTIERGDEVDSSLSPPQVVVTQITPVTRRVEKQINEEVRRMMGDLFGALETELVNFISYYESVDPFYCMHALVRLSQHVMSAQDTGSFLSMSFASALVQSKRHFDRFMLAQLRSVEEARANRRSKCGILPFVANLEEFAITAEGIFKHTDRRTDLDKWYVKLVAAMFEAIPRCAAEHHKTPQEVVKMENFHHLFSLLSQLKIAVLDGQRKEAKQRYNDALRAYVTQYFGRPLEKLNLFFDGVQAKVAQGVKESEISYQMAYSKQELRKVIKEYPAREVKKGLDNLYKKVEKHLCEQENLLQVVWRAMQEEFIQQYKYIEELIQRCYPGSMIALEFSIQNILEFFSEIARSH